MSKTKLVTDIGKTERVDPTISWYNCDYSLVNGVLLRSDAVAMIEELIAARVFTGLGDALRRAVTLLLIDRRSA